MLAALQAMRLKNEKGSKICSYVGWVWSFVQVVRGRLFLFFFSEVGQSVVLLLANHTYSGQ